MFVRSSGYSCPKHTLTTKTRQTGNTNDLVTYERYGATTRSRLPFTHYTMTKGVLRTWVYSTTTRKPYSDNKVHIKI
jgi:hypothetical protein